MFSVADMSTHPGPVPLMARPSSSMGGSEKPFMPGVEAYCDTGMSAMDRLPMTMHTVGDAEPVSSRSTIGAFSAARMNCAKAASSIIVSGVRASVSVMAPTMG